MCIYQIIRAEENQLHVVHDMAEVIFRHTYRDILSLEQIDYMMEWMYSLPNLKKQLSEGHVYYIAMRDETPCGYLSVQPEGLSDSGRTIYHLQKIYVMPSEQGKGLGRILFERAVSHVQAAEEGKPAAIHLNVNRNNPAVRFYEHLGMRILSQGDFPIGNGYYMNDYIMELQC